MANGTDARGSQIPTQVCLSAEGWEMEKGGGVGDGEVGRGHHAIMPSCHAMPRHAMPRHTIMPCRVASLCNTAIAGGSDDMSDETTRLMHRTIKKVTSDIEAMSFNTVGMPDKENHV